MIAVADMSDLARFLQQIFRERQWSGRRAAVELDMPRTTLNDIVTNKRKPEAETLRRIAEGLGIPLRQIFDLAGLPLEDATTDEQALYGLTDEQRAFLRSLPPEKKALLIEMARQFLGES